MGGEKGGGQVLMGGTTRRCAKKNAIRCALQGGKLLFLKTLHHQGHDETRGERKKALNRGEGQALEKDGGGGA